MGGVQLHDEPQPSHRARYAGVPAGHHQPRRRRPRLGQGPVHHPGPARHSHRGSVPGADAGRGRKRCCSGRGCLSHPASSTTRPCWKTTPDYLASLASLPEAEKQALLYGSWDSFSGQVFTEWRNDPAHYQDQRWTHVIAPFPIPKHWKIYRGFDFGFSKPFSVGWYAADEEGRLYRIKELYGCTGRPNEGLRIDPVEQARRIREVEQNDPQLRGRGHSGHCGPGHLRREPGREHRRHDGAGAELPALDARRPHPTGR